MANASGTRHGQRQRLFLRVQRCGWAGKTHFDRFEVCVCGTFSNETIDARASHIFDVRLPHSRLTYGPATPEVYVFHENDGTSVGVTHSVSRRSHSFAARNEIINSFDINIGRGMVSGFSIWPLRQPRPHRMNGDRRAWYEDWE